MTAARGRGPRRTLRAGATATLLAGLVAAVRQRREAVGAARTGRGPERGPAGVDTAPADGGGLAARLATWTPAAPRTPAGRRLAALWAGPLTLVGAIVAVAGGGVPRYDAERDCWIATRVRGPSAAALATVGAAANTIGRVIVVRGGAPSAALLDHEAGHVRQAERLGPLLPVAYAWAGAVHGYAANPFERSARRAARRAAALRTAGGGS